MKVQGYILDCTRFLDFTPNNKLHKIQKKTTDKYTLLNVFFSSNILMDTRGDYYLQFSKLN